MRSGALGACTLVALALLVTGCGGATSAEYSPADVAAAFDAEGISLYGSGRWFGTSLGGGARRSFGQDRVAAGAEGARPLTSLAQGARDLLLPKPAEPRVDLDGPVVLRSRYVNVTVYPGDADAKVRAAELEDIIESELLLGEHAEFGYFHDGNVVVDYRVFDEGSRVVDGGRLYSPREHERRLQRLITAALARLD